MNATTETIREAARLMRERAEAATPSPWGVGNDTNIVRGLEVTGRGSYTCIQSVAEVDDDRCDWDRDEAVETSPEYDAEHIASWHPAVALAVADWLDTGANPYSCVDREPMLRVARAYLGEVSR